MFEDIPRNIWRHFPECLATFPGMFGDIHRNFWRHSPECLATFPGMFEDIPWNVWRHSPECLWTFPGTFGDIPRNVCGHSPECLGIFPGMFGDIPRNITFTPFPAFPSSRSPVFLVLYIALHFHARKHVSFSLVPLGPITATKFTISCEFDPLQVKL